VTLDPSWVANVPRYRERWSPAEDALLLRLFEEHEARPRRVLWFGAWKKGAAFAVAKRLGRSPCACSARRGLLRSWERRKN
jgi:hypothetical protein